MEKIVTVGGYDIPVRSTAASLFSYKANFGRDGLRDMIALTKGIPDGKDGKITAQALLDSEFELDVFFRFLWVFAKAKDKDILPLAEWMDQFEVPPLDFITEALPQIMDLLTSTVASQVAPKN